MPQDVPYEGVVGRTLDDSTPWWPPLPSAPDGAPNVVVVLLDDVGYAQFGCYGSDIATPTFDRLARDGLRYSNFHTTALCSPTRACLLTGRNHHSNGMGRIVEFAQGFPGYDATIPKANGMLSEVLREAGYANFAVGKWHLTPAPEMTTGASKQRWPLGRGFDRFYGFMAGETDQYHPDLVHDNHQVDPPGTPEAGYHLTEDLADHAIAYIDDLREPRPIGRSSSTSRPVLVTRRTRHRANTSRSTAVASTTAGIDGATKSSRGRSRRLCCPKARTVRSGRTGSRPGTRSAPTSNGCTPA